MRSKAAVVVLVLTLVSSGNITGQQDSLPPVNPQAFSDATALGATPLPGVVREEPTVYLPAVPLRENMAEPSLIEAAQDHDYATFHEQYVLARSRGERVAQFDALHELWSWSMSSPTGAFYGPELYARIVAAYPNFAAYIDSYRIVDRNGNVFYPTAETRAFLLDQALRNQSAPRVLIAGSEPSTPVVREIQSAPMLTPSRTRSRARMQKAEAAPVAPPAEEAASAAPVEVAAATPAPLVAAPVVNTAATQPAPQAVAQSTPAPQPAATLAAMTPVPVKPADVQAATATRSGRAILMIVIGLLGAGILAVLLRASNAAPATATATVMPAAKTADADIAKVEPIRMPEDAAPRTEQQTDAKKNRRAHGSRR